MNITTEDLKAAKEKKLTLAGCVGELEAIFTGSEHHFAKPTLAILGHPHSLHGGSMNNKVITTLAKACQDVGIPTLRFNFRGVGNSAGEFDRGIGESEDALKVLGELAVLFPEHQFILAGFSFGAYVTYRAACQTEVSLLLSVAPAVNHGDFSEFSEVPQPWHVLVAEKDEIVAKNEILSWHSRVYPAPSLHLFDDCSHFFHGKLVILREKVQEILLESL